MRLIDADELNSFIDKWLSKKCDANGNTTPNKWLNSLKRCVEEQPTAYDVDKVVAELEQLADASNDHMYESYFDGKEDGIREAIEIVKQGCVSGDVCEWKLDGVYLHSPHKPLVSCVTDKNYRYYYCPVCGKKIKAVE